MRFIHWLFDFIGRREVRNTYTGHGDYDSERGWIVLGHWFPYE